MKKVNYLLTLLMAAIVLSSCGGLNKMKETANLIKYTVTPDPLEDHADVVALDIKGNFPAKFFNKKALVTATPVLVFDGGETAFDPKTLQGESVQENNDVINFENGGSFSYSSTIPYSDGMQLSDLEIRLVGKIKETSVPFDPVKIAEGVIITPKLVAINPKSLIMKDKFVRINPDSYGADIHYVINRSEVRNAEISQEDIVKLKDYIMEIQEIQFNEPINESYFSQQNMKRVR